MNNKMNNKKNNKKSLRDLVFPKLDNVEGKAVITSIPTGTTNTNFKDIWESSEDNGFVPLKVV